MNIDPLLSELWTSSNNVCARSGIMSNSGVLAGPAKMIDHDRPVDTMSSLATQKYPMSAGFHEALFLRLSPRLEDLLRLSAFIDKLCVARDCLANH